MSSPNTDTTTTTTKKPAVTAAAGLSAPKLPAMAPPATPANRPPVGPVQLANASPLSPTPLSTPDDPSVFTTSSASVAFGGNGNATVARSGGNVANIGRPVTASTSARAVTVNVQSPGTPSPVPQGARGLPAINSAIATMSTTPSALTTTAATPTVPLGMPGPVPATVGVTMPPASTTAAAATVATGAIVSAVMQGGVSPTVPGSTAAASTTPATASAAITAGSLMDAASSSTPLLPSAMSDTVVPTTSGEPIPRPTQIVPLHDAYADLPELIDDAAAEHLLHPSTASSSSSAPPPAAPHSASNRLADKMELTRIAAMARDFYLAQGDVVRNSTGWYRDGRGDALVYRDAADAAREAQAAHAADPGVMPPPEMPLRAPLTIIATITADRCFLRPDGNFRGPNPALPFFRPFAQTTLTCALGPPPAEFPALVNDFNAGCRVFRSLLPATVNGSSGHVYQNVAGQHLRLRHALFAPKPDPADEVDDGVTLPAEFTMAGWPTYSPQASQALADIANTHIVRPLPAYDVHGDLIPPSRYLSELRGATVQATFSVTVYHISEQNQGGRSIVRTNVCLDIEYLRVLITPPQFSPKKRRAVHLTDPVSNAAGKRRRISW